MHSGADHCIDPGVSVLVRLAPLVSVTTRERPKSDSFAQPSTPMRMLPDLMSRCLQRRVDDRNKDENEKDRKAETKSGRVRCGGDGELTVNNQR